MQKTLRQLVIQLGVASRDNVKGTTTLSASGSNRNQMTDEHFKGDANDTWKGSEVLFLTDPPEGYSNPKEVAGFDGATGTFTLDSDWSASVGVPSGVSFVLMRLRGSGLPFDYRIDALQYAIEKSSEAEVYEDLGAYVQDGLLAIPLGVDTIWEVSIGSYVVPKDRWYLRPGGQLGFRSTYTADAGTVYVSGGYVPDFDRNLNTVYSVHSSVVNDALEYLVTMSSLPNEQAAENRLFQERMRRDPGEYRRPNERKVLR